MRPVGAHYKSKKYRFWNLKAHGPFLFCEKRAMLFGVLMLLLVLDCPGLNNEAPRPFPISNDRVSIPFSFPNVRDWVEEAHSTPGVQKISGAEEENQSRPLGHDGDDGDDGALLKPLKQNNQTGRVRRS
ncbi:hypothetical protein ACFL2O_06635 [Thermodesulfobacteriota bacterium]